MAFLRWAGLRIAMVSALTLLCSNIVASGLSSWTQSAEDFQTGQVQNIHLENGTLMLDACNISLNDWVNVTITSPSAPPGLLRAGMAYDEKNQVAVLFGGLNYETTIVNDTWIFNQDKSAWNRQNPSIAPGARQGSKMVYDPGHGQMMLFGGFSELGSPSPGTLFNDTWTYDTAANQWTLKNTTDAPSPRMNMAMAYDTKRNQVVLFGGAQSGAYNNAFILNDTWIYNPQENRWTNVSPPVSPQSRQFTELAYDSSDDIFMLFGGRIETQECIGETWTYDAGNNIWTNMSPSISPPAMESYGLVFIPQSRQFLLFGGCDGPSKNSRNETWVYNHKTNNWSQLYPSASPAPRGFLSMAYDNIHANVILFGGLGNYGQSSRPYWNDTWLYRPLESALTGTYTSRPFDMLGNAFFGNISWDASVAPDTGLRFQVRTSLSNESMENQPFSGPDGTAGSYYTDPGQKMSGIHNGTRWVQYRAYFNTSKLNVTPTLASVTIKYNVRHSISIVSPAINDVWTGLHNITWTASDPDNGSLLFDISVDNGTAMVPIFTNLGNDVRSQPWNTSAFPNGSYRISITARDDNPSIPISTNATSSYFTLRHPVPPPPNHPPTVELVYPPNRSVINTTSVRLAWKGIDEDGDLLWFGVAYSDKLLELHDYCSTYIQDEYLDIHNLTDGSTYYWNVLPDDNRINWSIAPGSRWSFSVRLPPVNHPPKFSSLPNTSAWVGQEYAYNLTSIDEDGDMPVYSIVSAPPAMVIDSKTGKLHWTPTTSDIGNHTITLQVSDGRGSTDNQTFTIEVKEIPKPPFFPPKCAITYPANGTIVNRTIQIKGTAINGSFPLTAIKVRIDNGTWSSAIGLEHWTISLNTIDLSQGSHRIEAKAFAANMSSDAASADFIVRNQGPGVTAEGNPWCLPAAIIIIAASITVLIVLRRRTKP